MEKKNDYYLTIENIKNKTLLETLVTKIFPKEHVSTFLAKKSRISKRNVYRYAKTNV